MTSRTKRGGRTALGLLAASALFLSTSAVAAPAAGPDPGIRTAPADALRGPRPPSATPAAPADTAHRTSRGMVVSATRFASEVGVDVLRNGGNAVDAAIATGFALAVTHPAAGNIGGGGFMVIRFPDGRATAFDFREKAPLRAEEEMFLDEDGEYSYRKHHDSHLAVGVPGTVAGFDLAHERYGSGEWSRLVEPAVGLAREGFPVSERLAGSLRYLLDQAGGRYPATVEAFSRDGEPYRAGETLRQPDLASTLERIRDRGREGFYRGETARLLADEMRRGGGLITEEDLLQYVPVEREPITGSFHDYGYIGMPPPSSGGTAVLQMLKILEGFDLGSLEHGSADHLHLLTEAMRVAYRDRARYLADTDFEDVPIDRLTSEEHARELRAGIDPARAGRSRPAEIEDAAGSEQTTHYSVVDEEGTAVSVTYTLEQGYGSKIVVPGAGFLLNNEMGDFNPKRGLTTRDGLIGTEPNLVEPGKRMLSSMSPSILTRDGELVAVVGTPGGRTIINTVLQVILNVSVFGMELQEAVDAPRIHHQWLPDVLRVEEDGFAPEVLRELERRGHRIETRSSQGRANSIMIDPVTGDRLGAPDPRNRDAWAAGH